MVDVSGKVDEASRPLEPPKELVELLAKGPQAAVELLAFVYAWAYMDGAGDMYPTVGERALGCRLAIERGIKVFNTRPRDAEGRPQ